MQHRQLDGEPVSARTARKRVILDRAFRTLNLVGYVAIVVVIYLLVDRLQGVQRTNLNLQRDVSHYHSRLAEAHQQTLRRIEQSESRTLESITDKVARIRDRNTEENVAAINTSKELLEGLADREQSERNRILTELRRTQKDIVSLRGDLKESMLRQQRRERVFQKIQQHWDPSILLIHSSFTYRSRNDEGDLEEHFGSGWGTGFAVTKEGHIVTNKHVVQPWKFDPELCAMSAMGEVEIDKDSLRLQAWPSGVRCLDENRDLLTTVGFNNTRLKNLSILKLAKDHMTTKEISLGGSTIPYTIHALDNNDLAILKADGATFEAVPCDPLSAREKLQKLEHVMALGFPRGQNGLERGFAETSPSLGTIRKAEDTIHVTASIIPGNSGGPLFNEDGKVIGIATRIYSETLGICIKVNHATDLLSEALAEEKKARKIAAGKKPSKAPAPPVLMAVDGEK